MSLRRKNSLHRRAPRHLERSNTTKALQAGNVKLCYAFYTQAGADGDGDKENQDCLAVEVLRHERDRDVPPVMFFGVFDGHGDHGGTVAALAAEQLPQFVQELRPNVRQEGDPGAALLAGFSSIQQYLLQQPEVDCSLSGCTAVVVLIVDDSLVVANAGDSRCLAGRFEGDADVVAYELSNDHTPALLHEANRVLASGGRIAPLQFAGSNVGPPRVWERGADMPGLCITRSLGDTYAKRLGVTHMPELSTFKLTAGDRYLALVSDGITEFMGSQEIIEKIHKWASVGTMPHEVARRLVREARTRWRDLGDEGIVDDCTAIIAYLVCDEEDEEAAAADKKSRRQRLKKAKAAKSRLKAGSDHETSGRGGVEAATRAAAEAAAGAAAGAAAEAAAGGAAGAAAGAREQVEQQAAQRSGGSFGRQALGLLSAARGAISSRWWREAKYKEPVVRHAVQES